MTHCGVAVLGNLKNTGLTESTQILMLKTKPKNKQKILGIKSHLCHLLLQEQFFVCFLKKNLTFSFLICKMKTFYDYLTSIICYDTGLGTQQVPIKYVHTHRYPHLHKHTHIFLFQWGQKIASVACTQLKSFQRKQSVSLN